LELFYVFSVVAKINMACFGGSNVFRKALKAEDNI
jgi:hypothetical protein